ncbi:expressed unknown protein [Seminavis robusta]|uniref:Uncharacterized protein n=1 Tax=Seminavis robusta TaxID=568900 RepID=A0A9N8DX26_9STRA|nr:expressed unknown protein [Seminavis robusta]|eukprot:Sro441_g143630.1 n/a (839) ;mRNA; r:14752-17429
MRLSNALHAVLAAACMGPTAGIHAFEPKLGEEARKLQQQEDILDYSPLTQVTDQAALDLDLLTMENLLNLQTPESMAQAQAVYEEGAFTQNYAVLTLTSPVGDGVDLPKGMSVSGPAFVNPAVQARGFLMEDLQAGATEVLVAYATSASQRSYVGCQVGASPDPTLDECFGGQGIMSIGGPDDPVIYNLDYTYNALSDNKNGRSLQSISTNARDTMYNCDNCPYGTYEKFFNYYSSFDYGNEMIMAAFTGGSTNFANGNLNFGNFESTTSDGVVEFVHKGSVFLNVFMQVIKSMEDACYDCDAGCPVTGCGDDNTNPWDKAVAYFVGSMAKVTDGDEGDFLYNIANKRCRSFGTCEGGSSKASDDIMAEFLTGQRQLLVGNCAAARTSKDRISNLMAVPLIQGTLRFAYLKDVQDVTDERANALGAVYASGVLPLVHACSPVDAQVIYSNMMLGALLSPRFEEVKSAFERNYRCLGLTCADIGGLVLASSGDSTSSIRNFVSGGEPCVDSEILANEGTTTQPAIETETTQPAVESETMQPAAESNTTQPAAESNATQPVVTSETTQPAIVETAAPTTLVVNLTTSETQVTVTTTQTNVTVTTTQTDVTISSGEPESTVDSVTVCPPCSAAFGGDSSISATKTVEECPGLVKDQIQNIPPSCDCACFVNSNFAFCATPDIIYSGSGSLVGPCEVGSVGGAMEEEESEKPEETAQTGTGVFTGPATEEYPEEEEKPKPDREDDEEETEEEDTAGIARPSSGGGSDGGPSEEEEALRATNATSVNEEEDELNQDGEIEVNEDRPTFVFANSATSGASSTSTTLLSGFAAACLFLYATVSAV